MRFDTPNAQRLRIYVGDGDRFEGQPLHAVIVRAARGHGFAGATVFQGVAGYGASRLDTTTTIQHFDDDLPMVIEIADSAELVQSFIPLLEQYVSEGLVTLENIAMVAFRAPD